MDQWQGLRTLESQPMEDKMGKNILKDFKGVKPLTDALSFKKLSIPSPFKKSLNSLSLSLSLELMCI